MKARQKGFTLVELMITVAIIGILSAVAIPAYNDYVLKGKLSEAFTQLSSVQLRMEQYYQDNRSYGTTGVCGIPNPTGTNFTYACVPSSCSGFPVTCQGFTVTATGVGNTAGFTYTIDETATKATTAAPTGWGPTNTACWVRGKSGAC